MKNQNVARKYYSLFKDFKFFVCFLNENLLPKINLYNTIVYKKMRKGQCII